VGHPERRPAPRGIFSTRVTTTEGKKPIRAQAASPGGDNVAHCVAHDHALERSLHSHRESLPRRRPESARLERPHRAGAAGGTNQRPRAMITSSFSAVMGNRVLVADPSWGKPEIDKFQRIWLDDGEPIGHVGFVVERANGRKLPKRSQPKLSDFVTLQQRCIDIRPLGERPTAKWGERD
jgi:hypothetical protein